MTTRMKKKYYILIIFLADISISFGQKTLSNFDGNLIFKESFFYYPITRTTYDTIISYSNYEIGKMTQIEQMAAFSAHNDQEIDYLPIKFYKNKDSIFYKYADPYDIDHDTTYTKLFPLSFKDTIETAFCYKITMDTIRGTDKNRTVTIKTDCDGDEHEIKTYRIKDTTFTFKEYKIECYMFKQKAIIGHYKDIYFTRLIIVDKETLVPIDVKEYNFHSVKRVRYRNINQGKNLLTYHQRLISIE